MTGRRRQRLFLLAAVAISAALGALLLGGGGSSDPQRPHRAAAGAHRVGRPPGSGPATRLVDRVARRAPPRPEDEDRAHRPPPRYDLLRRRVAAQHGAATGFLDALLRYELGDSGPAVTSALRAKAEPALARLILSKPPRVLAATRPPAAGHLVDLEAAEPARRGNALLAATVQRGGRQSALLLELRVRRGRWLVSDLR
jgi:hypothetical protein